MDIAEAQQAVLNWATTANSYDKLGFLLALSQSFGMEEIHHGKNIMANVLKKESNRKRGWVGPNPVDSFNKRKRLLSSSEGYNPTTHFKPSFSLPRALSGVARLRGAKVAVVDSSMDSLYVADVYHRPSSFVVNRHTLAANGIGTLDLQHGLPMHLVTSQLRDAMFESLVIYFGGTTDFSSVDLDVTEFLTFNLQQFYRRSHENGMDTQPMSLRDMYFLGFNEDFQGNKVHSAETDAQATVKVFVRGYVRRNLQKMTRNDPHYFECFNDAKALKKMDAIGMFYCNRDKKFKNWKESTCKCSSCSSLFVWNRK
ncbi:unnamed protein product [Orchesella dallaii]|uniref:Exonuclease domain-containing protein n=1 Tax=Orchesella dallaii TaxID=48710 RepID=A0ABP1RG51_9HEXA